MEGLFNSVVLDQFLERVEKLSPDSQREWGKMNASQMVAHCARNLEMAMGERKYKQVFIGKILAPFVKPKFLNEARPLDKNTPTNPDMKFPEDVNFNEEKEKLKMMMKKFNAAGPSGVGNNVHPFFGKLKTNEWNLLATKHLDHHFKQFGV